MKVNEILKAMRFVTPALATPVNKDGSLDTDGLKNLVKYVLEKGMTNIFLLGYAGECLAFSREERRAVISAAREAAGDGVMIMAGVMDDSTNLVLNHISDAYDCGADCVLTTPTDFVHCEDDELRCFFNEINEKTKLPIFIYNCPENQHYLTPDLMSEFMQLENIIGLKQTSTVNKIQDMMLKVKNNDKFLMVSGDEFAYFPAMCLGVEGFIMGGPGNSLVPLSIEILNNFRAGKFEEARTGYFKMIGFLNELYFTLPYPTMMPQIKAMLEIGGVCGRWMTHPTAAVSDADMEKIKDMMKRHDIAM